MKNSEFIRDKNTTVTASDLAQCCICEQQFVFDQKYGKRRSKELAKNASAGIAVHKYLNAEAQLAYRNVETSQTDKRCFIASALFGVDAPETWQLRDFRDKVLIKKLFGRYLIEFYYQISPPIAAILLRCPRLAAIAKTVFRIVLWLTGGKVN